MTRVQIEFLERSRLTVLQGVQYWYRSSKEVEKIHSQSYSGISTPEKTNRINHRSAPYVGVVMSVGLVEGPKDKEVS